MRKELVKKLEACAKEAQREAEAYNSTGDAVKAAFFRGAADAYKYALSLTRQQKP